jgi:7,8-dihydroneopterin aldolase/epimerase/oxygenase
MLFIHLYNLRFYSHHGVFEEEKILGNEYEVNISVGFEPTVFPVNHIDETIDYTVIYQLVKARMAIPSRLLETIVTELAAGIQYKYSQVTKISISIKKLYPPVNNFEGTVGVSFEWNK